MEEILKVLILEDSIIDLEIIKRVLSKANRHYEYLYAANEAELKNILDENAVDIILSDNSLPQYSALEALEYIKGREINVPFIIVTGTMSEEIAVESMKAGVDDYLLKDRLTRLNAAIEISLQKKQVQSEKASMISTLQKSEEAYRTLVERISDGFMALDTFLNITYINKVTAQMFGNTRTTLIGLNLYDILPGVKNNNIHKAFQLALATNENVYLEEYSIGLKKWVSGSIYPSITGLSVYFRDITEQKLHQASMEELKQKEHLLLIAAKLEAQEAERNAIGQELHDNVNQILVGTSMLISHIIRFPDKHLSELEECKDKISEAITENRKIAHELVTPELMQEGLLFQMQALTKNMLGRNGINVVINVSHYNEQLLNFKQRLSCYRILQEQCTNIIKYANAKEVTIELVTLGNHKFIMKIADDGIGKTDHKKLKGIGFVNIASRLQTLSGKMKIPNTNKGFEIQIEFPLSG